MKSNRRYVARRVRDGERGQSLLMAAVVLAGLLAAAAFVIDLGRLYYSFQELQSATDASALAGAQDLTTTGTPIATATKYSAVPGNLNAAAGLFYENVTMVSTYPKLVCLTSTGVPCATISGVSANAIEVQEQAIVPMYFARLFGVSTLTIKATSWASAKGGSYGPFNVMVVMDTTGSMGDPDSSCAAGTRILCALTGARTMLGTLAPCGITLSSCGTTSGTAPSLNVANPVDEVGLEVFPPLSSASQAANDYNCSGTNPAITSYATATQADYEVIGYSSDYRNSDSQGLNSASDLVRALGGGPGGSAGCPGLKAPGGVGTFIADSITEAQATLVALSRPNTTNVIIVLSDGGANSPMADMVGPGYNKYTDQCQQTIAAAQAAARAGTWVYSIAYGALTTNSGGNGCTTDSTNYTGISMKNLTPCQEMAAVANSPGNIPDSSKFFSDGQNEGNGEGVGCTSTARPVSDLNTIFTDIANDFTIAHLVPVGIH